MGLHQLQTALQRCEPAGLIVEAGSGDACAELFEEAATRGWARAPHRKAQFARARDRSASA